LNNVSNEQIFIISQDNAAIDIGYRI
jgi:hypothetical protein